MRLCFGVVSDPPIGVQHGATQSSKSELELVTYKAGAGSVLDADWWINRRADSHMGPELS